MWIFGYEGGLGLDVSLEDDEMVEVAEYEEAWKLYHED